MDKLDGYRQIVREILTEHGTVQPVYGEISMKLLFDVERDRYQLLRTGWQGDRRVFGALIHIDLEDGKIWILYDGTEIGVANELTEKGGFQNGHSFGLPFAVYASIQWFCDGLTRKKVKIYWVNPNQLPTQ